MGSPRPTLRQIFRPARLWIGGLVFFFLLGMWGTAHRYFFLFTQWTPDPASSSMSGTKIQIGGGMLWVSYERFGDSIGSNIGSHYPKKTHWDIVQQEFPGSKAPIGGGDGYELPFGIIDNNDFDIKGWNLLLPLYLIPLLWLPVWFAGSHLLERKRMRHTLFPVEAG